MQKRSKAKHFAERVADLLTLTGMTQRELAWLLGISHVSVSRWVSGEHIPSKLTEMVIGALEVVARRGRKRALLKAVRHKSIRGGTQEAFKLIVDLAYSRQAAKGGLSKALDPLGSAR